MGSLMTRIQQCLAQNLKKLRKLKNLTQEQLASAAGTSTNYIGTIEIGKRFSSPQMIEKLANALQIDSPMLFLPEHVIDKTEKNEQISSACKKELKKTLLEHVAQAIEESLQ